MLRSLRIKNLALIDDLTWELEPGLNILTGETGAGKSILIDAFNLLLGERADKSLIRDGADECVVEGTLSDLAHLNGLLEESGLEPCTDGELYLKRTLSVSKAGRQFINGSPAPLQVLKQVGDLLADMHGPHDHQSLLSNESQLKALDAFAGLTEEAGGLSLRYSAILKIRQELEELNRAAEGDLERQLAFLDEQIAEIREAGLNPEEEQKLEGDYRAGTHSQRILELGGSIQNLLVESESDVSGLLAQVQRFLHEWISLDPEAQKLADANASIVAQVQDLAREVTDRADATELDAERLKQIEERLNRVQSLKRKYGQTVEAVLEHLVELETRREYLANREVSSRQLKERLGQEEKEFKRQAEALSRQRLKSAPVLAAEVSSQLRELGFKRADFSVGLASQELRREGIDHVEFGFAPNPGESSKPLKAIASSGEMARVMLAIKSVLAEKDSIPVLIFDEVDANVGGETAVAVGHRLRELAKAHQVLCITHLPQVAAAGHRHYRVVKDTSKGRTTTSLEVLEGKSRLDELARMLGDKSQTAKSLAESLLKQFQK